MDIEKRIKNLETALGWASICFCLSIWFTNAAVSNLNERVWKLEKKNTANRLKKVIGYSDENKDSDNEKRVIGFLSKDIK